MMGSVGSCTEGNSWGSAITDISVLRDGVWFVAVTLQFVAVGNAPLMKRTKFTVSGQDPLSVVGELCFLDWPHLGLCFWVIYRLFFCVF